MNQSKIAFINAIAQQRKKELTFNATNSEVKMKAILISLGVTFQFQYIIFTRTSFFVADFLITSNEGKKYIIELDGSVHFNYKAKRKDKNRSVKIRQSGYGVLRFNNSDVLTKQKKVIDKFKRFKIID